MRRIPCACNKCKYTLDKPWTPSVLPHQQHHYQPVKYFTYYPVLGYFNNWNITHFSHTTTSSEYIDKIHQGVLYGTSDNISTLDQNVHYGVINTTNTTTMGLYVIEFISE